MEFIKRLHKEQKDLSVKIEKLRDYITNNPHFKTLPENDTPRSCSSEWLSTKNVFRCTRTKFFNRF